MMSPISQGANSVIVAGVHIGKRCQIGAGSVVTKNIPDYSVAVGNPAKIIKRYNFQNKTWERTQELVPLVNNNSNHI